MYAAQNHGRQPAVFYDQRSELGSQRGKFDDIHLAQRPAGFSAYPHASKGGSAASGGRDRPRDLADRVNERFLVLGLTLLAAFTRLYRIGRANGPRWDESHFGKFGAYYINATFYHDVHPPLAKMLVGLSEVLAGHNGSFTFKGGETYPSYVNYTFMRMFNAAFGIALTPMAYVTCRKLRMPVEFAAMAALFVTFDNAICVMSRFILLDAPLLAFTGLALMMLACFYRQRRRAFSAGWWRFLVLTGVSLGLVASSKWVGLFAVALMGLYTLCELFEMFCDPRLRVGQYLKHWAARVLALIVIPLAIYMLCFKVHFALLWRYNNSANFMPMGFQVKLSGNPIARQPFDVETGSAVRLQSRTPGAGYLHSHTHQYPTGSGRQQVTGYGYADGNNLWNVQRRMTAEAAGASGIRGAEAANEAIPGAIGHGDVIALHHNATDTYLFADTGFEAPESKQFKEVSAVSAGDEAAKRLNALWVVEIVNPERRMDDGHVHPLGTPLRLRSLLGNCVLVASGERLDKNWGWGQAEIACSTAAAARTQTEGKYLWTIERHINKNQKATNLGQFMSSSFLTDFAVLNRQMWLTNNALVPDHDKHNVLESDPASWPFMLYPMRMVGWDDASIKYMEIGNPLLWWGSAVLCLLFPVQSLYWLVRWRRRSVNWRPYEFRPYFEGAAMLWSGWFLHYAPFFAMGRVTYLHHVLPSLYFGILFMAYQMYYATIWYIPRARSHVVIMSISVIGLVFWWFSPLTYGWDKPIKDLRGMEWMSSWPIYQDKMAL
ncbi:Protein O-mannosyltransferase 2 [Coemansia sp. RSA 2618]|nr:Protein O-mannosyltransferase 2 [Coemansia sp. RSA 2618]